MNDRCSNQFLNDRCSNQFLNDRCSACVNPVCHSIEDAKQKTEHDQMMKRAEEKKQHVRRMVASLRNIFQSLLQESAKLPKPLQLDRKEFVMDPDMEKQLLQQRDQRVGVR